MNRKLILTGTLFLALVLTSGTFAYTYGNTASAQLDVTAAGGQIVTSEPTAEQPDWESLLPEGDPDQVYLLPEAPGDDTELPTQFPDSGEHWDKVYDLPADDGATYVSTLSSKNWERDLYNLTNDMETGGSETISGITVYFRFAAGGGYDVQAMAEIKTDDEVFSGDTETHSGTEFVTMSHQWLTNPSTGEAWTWQEIDDLQAGVTMEGNKKQEPAICTQVYVVVDYVFIQTEGDVPEGDLFAITPHPDYPGDLLAKIYLTNTGELVKAYQYLNIKLYVANSMEAGKTPDYQILSMENGVVLFNIEGGLADNYTVEVVGGSYRLISSDSSEWGAGWNIVPEFYSEVSQR